MVTVTDDLLRPTLTVLRESATFVLGETATFRCSSVSVFAAVTFLLYRVGQSDAYASAGPVSSSGAVLSVSNVSATARGYYTCMYTVQLAGKTHRSTHSDRVQITIASLVEPPVISKSTDFHLYPQGQLLRLSCAAPKDYRARSFQLYRDGLPVLARTNVRDSVAEFTLVNTSMAEAGVYACDYRATVAGQEYNSSRSEGLLVEIAEEMKLRLANGSHPCEGRVEVTFGDGWGTVCDDQWGLLDARVACASAGCGMPLEAPTHARFGRGEGPIWLDDVACRGDEGRLWHCASRLWGTHNCHHGEDAGAVCSGVRPIITLDPDYGVFLKGESLSINCTVRERNTSLGIDFLRDGSLLSHRLLGPGERSGHLRLANLTAGDAGVYACRYGQQGAEGPPSSLVASVSVSVTDPPRAPTIDLVRAGGRAQIKCSVPNVTGNGVMYLLEVGPNGPQQLAGTPVTNATSTFPLNGSRRARRYSCVYAAMLEGRALNSTWAEPVLLTPPGSSNAKTIVGWFVACVIFLVLVAVSIYYFRTPKALGPKREYRIYVRERLLDDVSHIEVIDDDDAPM